MDTMSIDNRKARFPNAQRSCCHGRCRHGRTSLRLGTRSPRARRHRAGTQRRARAARCVGSRSGESQIDSGPTVFTMRWVFEELFAATGMNFADHVRAPPARNTGPPRLGRAARLDLFADEERSVEAIGDFAGAAEAARYQTFCRDSRRIYDILEKPFLRAAQPSMGGLIGADGLRGFAQLPQIKPFTSMWSALAQYFHDPVCVSCSGATPPIAAPHRSRHRPL